jgi:hypothetical protein
MYCILLLLTIILFSFLTSLEFHRIVPVLQTYKFVYDHVCFCVYVYLLDLFSTYERKQKKKAPYLMKEFLS